MADAVVGQIGQAALRARAGDQDPREVVEMTFDAFGKGGAGALASWMILSGDEDALDPILTAIHNLVDELGELVITAPMPSRGSTAGSCGTVSIVQPPPCTYSLPSAEPTESHSSASTWNSLTWSIEDTNGSFV